MNRLEANLLIISSWLKEKSWKTYACHATKSGGIHSNSLFTDFRLLAHFHGLQRERDKTL